MSIIITDFASFVKLSSFFYTFAASKIVDTVRRVGVRRYHLCTSAGTVTRRLSGPCSLKVSCFSQTFLFYYKMETCKPSLSVSSQNKNASYHACFHIRRHLENRYPCFREKRVRVQSSQIASAKINPAIDTSNMSKLCRKRQHEGNALNRYASRRCVGEVNLEVNDLLIILDPLRALDFESSRRSQSFVFVHEPTFDTVGSHLPLFSVIRFSKRLAEKYPKNLQAD